MTNPIGSAADTVSALLSERTRYEAWLAALESRRATTPPHIYERVHGDYVARLKYVNDQLASHQSSVRDAVTGLSARLAVLDREESGRRDELAEADVRASVGEISTGQAEEIVRRCREVIAGIGSERAAITTELARLRDVLSSGGAAAMGGSAPYQPLSGMTGGLGGPPPGVGATPQRSGFNELEFLKSVVNPPGGGSGAPQAPDAGRGALSGLPLVEQGNAAPISAASTGRPAVEDSRLAPRDSTGEVPAFLKDVPPEQVKTLKCQECGTMNYPTEWYCERCGAELAAM